MGLRRGVTILALLTILTPLWAQESLPLPEVPELPLLEPLPDLPETPDLDPLPESDGLLKRKELKFVPPTDLEVQGSHTKISQKNGVFMVTYEGLVRLRADTGLEVYADSAVLDQKQEVVTLSGNITAYENGLVSRGQRASYFYQRKDFLMDNLRTGFDRVLLEADQVRAVESKGRQVFLGENAGVTTHDVAEPNFWIRAKKITVIPDDRVIFRNLQFRLGGIPVLWLPYLSQPIDQNLGYHFLPGGRSNLGLFLKNRYGVMLGGTIDPLTGEKDGAWLLAQWRADAYSRRGLGLGVDLFDTRVDEADDFGWLKLYHIYDFDPSVERSGIPRDNEQKNRYRIDFAHRFLLGHSERARYDFQADLTWLSDRFFLEDFEEKIFREDPAPDNTFAFTRRTASSLATLGGRVRLNDFYQSDTRLPELTFDWIKQPLFHSKYLYESQTSLGLYDEFLSSFDRDDLRNELTRLAPTDPRRTEIETLLAGPGFARLHTYHEISRPTRIGHYKIVPRVGGGYTHYGSVEGPSDSTGRGHFFLGLDTSLKFTKAYEHWRSQKWGLDGALHVVQPYANLSWLSTNQLDASFPRIDRLSPSTRPRPLSVGRFTQIDDFADWSILRLGMRHRLVTPRDGATHDWLTLDTYLDLFFNDPEFSRKVSNLYNDLVWHPLPWLRLDVETQFPLFSESNFTEVATGATFLVNKDLEVALEHRFLKNHPVLRDSNRLALEAFYRVNERWGLGAYNRWEFEDSTLELQQYSVHYDFDSWVGSAGFFHRDNRRKDEFGLVLSFGLKDFPSLALPFKIDAE